MKVKQSILISVGMALLMVAVVTAVTVEAPPEEWNKTFTDPGDGSIFYSVQQTTDDGYIIAGQAKFAIDEEEIHHTNALLIKTDKNGTYEWNKTFGGVELDYRASAYSVQQTTDGGYILAGDKDPYNVWSYDAWLIKTSSDGTHEWNMTFGGTENEKVDSVQQTFNATTGDPDGYIMAGRIANDAWLIKTSTEGIHEWNKSFGGTGGDYFYSVQQTSDGGYIMAGQTGSGKDYCSDAWLVKTSSDGTHEWNMTFGNVGVYDYAYSVQQTTDGGYIMAGYIYYPSIPSDFEALLIKTNEYGEEQWNMTFKNAGYDKFYSVQQVERGYIAAGETGKEAWLIKTDVDGNEEWNKTFEAIWGSDARSVQQTSDGGYIMAGFIGTMMYQNGLLIKVAGTTQVDDPFEAIENLQIYISTELELDPGISDSLILGLDDVVEQLENGDENKAIKKLNDFIRTVEKLEKKGVLTEEQAEELIEEAEYIIDLTEDLEE